ncbi:MAG: hypothetical protein R6X13_11385 [bacterium]
MKKMHVIAALFVAAAAVMAFELPVEPGVVVRTGPAHTDDFRPAPAGRAATPVWTRLERMSTAERQNSQIHLMLETSAPAEAQALALAIAEDWNAGRCDKALADFPRLAELAGSDIAIGNGWRTPVPTLDTRLWGNDVRIGNRDSAVLVNLDIQRSSGNLAAVLMFQGDGYTNLWTMNHSTNGGANWSETHMWWANYDLRSLSAAVLANHCYIAFGRNAAQNQAFLYRCRMNNGQQENFSNGSPYVTVATTPTGDTLKEVKLAANQDFFNNRLYYLTLTTSGKLRFYWDDSAAVSWDSTPGLTVDNAKAGLDACTNEGYDSSYIFVSYFDATDRVNTTARRGTGWRTLISYSAGNVVPPVTAISAYYDTVLVAFKYNGSAANHVRYLASYNGGTTWVYGNVGEDTTTTSESPDVALRAGGGSAVAYRYYTSTRQLRYTWRRYRGAWTTPVSIADHEPYFNKPAIEHLGGGTFGVAYTNWLTAPARRVFFDRTDWTGLAEQRKLIVEDGVLAVTPSPLVGRGRVRLNLARGAGLDVKVLDRAGRVVADVFQGSRPAGRSELSLDCSNLAPGVYFIRATADGEPLTVPFTVVR